jgi:hypothetical protein
MRKEISPLRLLATLIATAQLLLGAAAATAAGPNASDHNYLVNSGFKPGKGETPADWNIKTLPGCGFRFVLHQYPGASNEFEIINDEAVESSIQQLVHLAPGWYSFSVEIKVESLGSAGAEPEIFVHAGSLPISTRVHLPGWSSDWRKLALLFRAGSKVPDVLVGCSLGRWGAPNTGQILIRNPALVAVTDPERSKLNADFQQQDTYDLDALAEQRYGKALAAQAAEAAQPRYRLGPWVTSGWAVAAIYAGFLLIAGVGWIAVSPKAAARRQKNHIDSD